MRFSKKKISSKLKKEASVDLYQALADLQKPEDIQKFLEAFLTKAELLMLSKRLAIAIMLEKYTSYAEIKKKLGVSSATIASVQEMLKKKPKEFALVLKQVEAEKWASQTAQKISSFFKSFSPNTLLASK